MAKNGRGYNIIACTLTLIYVGWYYEIIAQEMTYGLIPMQKTSQSKPNVHARYGLQANTLCLA